MPDVRQRRTVSIGSLPGAVKSNALVAAAERMTGSITDHLIQNRGWQREAWDFYHAMGEYWYGVTWLANACSRVRLVAAKNQPGGDEPERLDPKTATGTDRKMIEIVEALAGGVGGRSAMLKALAVQLTVPGEGYVVGEQRRSQSGDLLPAQWSTKSSDEIRRREFIPSKRSKRDPTRGIHPLGGVPNVEIGAGPSPYEVQIEENQWIPLGDESLVCRVWDPDEQYSWRAKSCSLPALPILRELDLLNRRIIAELIARIAMNGFLLIPSEATFPTRPEFKDAPDPFIAELIDTASKAIKTPGSAAAAIPIPIRAPADLIEKIKHLKVAEYLDPKLMDGRDRAIKRLAATMNVPQEAVLGIADVNHWNAWQIDESGVKLHISPVVELICQGLTAGYMRPVGVADGISELDVLDYVMWYDVSELTTHPDLSQNGKDAHDRVVVTDAAYRREAGFSEDDAPSDDEAKKQILTALALQGNAAAAGILFPDLKDALAPPPPPGYDPETGRPLAPEPPPGTPVQPGNQQSGAPANGRVPVSAGGQSGSPSGGGR